MPEVKSLLVFPVSFNGQEAAEAERCSFASRIIYLRRGGEQPEIRQTIYYYSKS